MDVREKKLIPLDEERCRKIEATLNLADYRRVMNAQRDHPELKRLERMERRLPADDGYDWDEVTRKRVKGRRLEEP